MAFTSTDPDVYDMEGDFFTTFNMEKGPVLGVGMTGEVMSVWRKENPDVRKAVKTFSPLINSTRHRTLFEKEVSIMKKVDHPHLVKMLLAVRCPGYSIICMELYPGGDLERKIYNLDMGSVQRYLVQVSCGLQYLHSKRIVHCDVKLANILLDSQDNAVLGDFGVSITVPGDQNTVALIECGGTPTYWAPEAKVNSDDFQVDPFKLDAYALGVVLWGMALKERPSYVYNYLQELAEAEDARTDFFRTWIELLLEPSPNQRISVEQLLRILKAESEFGHLVEELNCRGG